MKANLMDLLALGFLAGIGNILGGLILFPSELYKKLKSLLGYLLAFGAGFMIAVIFAEILPKIIRIRYEQGDREFFLPMILLLSGYLLTHLLEHTIAPHFHLGEEISEKGLISVTTAYTAVAGIAVHTFFDGVSIAAAYMLDYKTGVIVFLAIFLHKIPEGFTVASMFLASGKSYKHALKVTFFIGFTTFLGTLIFLALGKYSSLSSVYILPFASGITLYVAASDLIPEINHHGGRRPIVSLSVLGGVVLFFGFHLTYHLIFEK
ncbi:MAG: ZIP family metal transporter [Pyrinomonadaceae bacterium]|nr:ZIP family metal transporter [Pyrinomonadaceae bacterium]MCX7639769.1 ZIP family metal transporter [Pyrinomonadaceae bacterium]MDW8304352.1 ZIP family metal transporter [Acidobacteriota bacterium]